VLAGSTFSARTAPKGTLLDVLRSLRGVSKVEEVPVSPHEDEATNTLYRMYAEDVRPLVGQATRILVEAGADLQDLQLIKPSLEDVFIYLTGRNLRT
jgi:ABC-2 type transport system ATP-binding protein